MKLFKILFLLFFIPITGYTTVYKHSLENGLKIFVKEDNRAPIVVSQVWYRAGSLDEVNGKTGVAHLLEHMMFTQSKRDVSVYWGGRRPADLYLHDWMMATVAAMPNVRYIPVVSDAAPEDEWTGRTGFVHQAVLNDFADLSGMEAYVCGAPIVVESAQRDFVAARGLPADAFFADSFTSAADKVTET